MVYRGIHAEAVAGARELLARQDFSSARHLLDVGGGSGGLALTVTASYPQLQATVVDLATVTPITQRYVTEAGLAERVHVMTADVVHGPRPVCLTWRSCCGSFRCCRQTRRAVYSATSVRSSSRAVSSILSGRCSITRVFRHQRPWQAICSF